MLTSLSSEELQFIKAIESYKTENNKIFLSWTEVLKIVQSLGYQKVARRAGVSPLKKTTRKRPRKAATETQAVDPAVDASGTETTEAEGASTPVGEKTC